MNYSELALYAIIRKRYYQLLKPENIDFFYNKEHKKILEGCFVSRLRKVEITPEIIKNWLSQNLKASELQYYTSEVDRIATGNKYIDVGDIEDGLKTEFYENQWGVINNVLSDSSATQEMKMSIVNSTHEVINRTKKVDDFSSVVKTLKASHEKVKSGEKSELFKNAIKLEDQNMIKVFGDFIYPLMHVILARPNSYKTTLLYNLIYEFSKMGKRGIIVSTEDIEEMIAIKLFSIISGLGKQELIVGNYDKRAYEKALEIVNDNIYTMDRLRTPDEMYVDLNNKLSTGSWDYVAVDYLQGAKRERYQTETEKAEKMVDVSFELNKEFKVPFFNLSQAPKANVQSKAMLGLGEEKGSSAISEKARWACSLNSAGSDDKSPYDMIIANVYKTTLSAKGQRKIMFHKKTGIIQSVDILDG